MTVYDQAGSSAEAGFTVWRDATPPPAPTDPLINGGDAWDEDGTVTLTWGQVSDGQSGLEGYYAALGDEAPTVQADSVLSDTETWAGADTPAAPYYVRARDNVGNWGLVASDTIGIDTLPPLGSLHSIAEASPYAYASGDTAYYSNVGSGSFTVRVAASDTGSGLDQAEYPETTSPGGVYYTALGGEYQYEHGYEFDGSDEAEGTYTVTLQDGIGRQSSVGFAVIHDATPPTLTLAALMHGTDVHVTWSATDGSSGVDAGTCLLEVREDEGAWQPFSTGCGGDDTYEGEPGHTYTFRLTASDNVGNDDSLEAEAVVPYAKKYYYANGQRVAMREGDVVYYIHSDHLGSASVLSEGDGEPMPGSRVAYLPYGGLRLGDASTLPTDYTFTGQRNEAGLGLMHYGARFYSPRLGRFVSADSIVPEHGDKQAAQWPLRVGVFKPQDIARVGEENRQTAQYGFWFLRGPEARQKTVHPTGPTNPQELNRYAYCLGNPLRYVDPKGEQFEVIFAIIVITVMIGPEVVLLGALIFEGIRKASSPDTPEPSPTSTPPKWGIGDITLCDICPTPVIPLKLGPTPTPGLSIGPQPTPTPTATRSAVDAAVDALELRNRYTNPGEATQLTLPDGNSYGQKCSLPWPGGPGLRIFDLGTGVTQFR